MGRPFMYVTDLRLVLFCTLSVRADPGRGDYTDGKDKLSCKIPAETVRWDNANRLFSDSTQLSVSWCKSVMILGWFFLRKHIISG